MADAGRHPNITLLTNSEVKAVTGYVGNFQVKVLKHARFVDEKECTACGDCAKVCPVTCPDEFNEGLSTRRAIYQPFPQAVPSAYIIDKKNCLGHDPIICGKCMERCDKHCIDFTMNDQEFGYSVGTIVVATGMQIYDPTVLDEYGYTRHDNVLTAMELERLINGGGPTQGEVVRISDRARPKSVAFIQCVGSRSLRRGNPYCSNICCMNTIKATLQLKEHYPDIEVKVFYIDIRAFGKGFEELFRRSREMGVRFIRGLPGSIKEDPKTKDLILTVENTASNQLETHQVEMVVLATGVHPPEDMKIIQEMLALQRHVDGFYLEAHPKLQPVDSATRGIFFAGCAEGPKDIKESVTQASAAAARAMRLMAPGKLKAEAIGAEVDQSLCTICGICARVCPYNAIGVDVRAKVPAKVNAAACMGCGTCAAECPSEAIAMHHFTDGQIMAQVDAILSEQPDRRVVVFACNWCSYAGADFAGINRMQYPANSRLVRTMCSGRVSEKFVWHAFERGAPVVLVSGCHIGDCHYINANHWTERRVKKMWRKMEKMGLRAERLQLEWISAAEGVRFRQVMERMEELRAGVSAEEIALTRVAIEQERQRPKKKSSPPVEEAVPPPA
jgi:heterodisulfide reductase subunit A